MRSQISLGRVFGIKIGLHYSWFIIAFLIIFSLTAQFHASDPEWGDGLILALAVLTAILFFVSLLLHELAHSVVAKSRGLPVREITLFALGGVSQIEQEPTSAKTEFWMALVGPLTSACIGLICLALSGTAGAPSSPARVMVSWLGYINIALAVFNMIPGYPLDGGRILRALVWWKTGDMERSTRLVARVGQAVALIFIGFGILQFFGGRRNWRAVDRVYRLVPAAGGGRELSPGRPQTGHRGGDGGRCDDLGLSNGQRKSGSPTLRRRGAFEDGAALLCGSGEWSGGRFGDAARG